MMRTNVGHYFMTFCYCCLLLIKILHFKINKWGKWPSQILWPVSDRYSLLSLMQPSTPLLLSWAPVAEINCILTVQSTQAQRHTWIHNSHNNNCLPGIRPHRLAKTANLSGPHVLKECWKNSALNACVWVSSCWGRSIQNEGDEVKKKTNEKIGRDEVSLFIWLCAVWWFFCEGYSRRASSNDTLSQQSLLYKEVTYK